MGCNMKIIVGIILFFVLSLVVCRLSFATDCSTDIDCKMYDDERCIIPDSARRGVCVKSFRPRKEDSHPASDPAAPSKHGQFCMTNRDCDTGQSCVKKENALSGTCY